MHFFHHSEPKTSFQRSKNNATWVPAKKIVRKVTRFVLTTGSRKIHNITDKLCNEI